MANRAGIPFGVALAQHLCAVCAVGATAAADPKPTLAVAGVYAKDAGTVKLAEALTASLRAMGGRYRLQGTPKEVAAAALKVDCNNVQPACAAAIGGELGVDYVLSGEVESRGDHPILVLSLVNVQTGHRVRSVRDSVARSADPRKWAKLVYERIAGANVGELVVVANAQRGDVVLDGQPIAALFDGRATITGIAPGGHQLEIRAPGYRPFAIDITVDGTTRESLLLDPIGD